MHRMNRRCLAIAATLAGATLIAIPAAGMSLEEAQELCTALIELELGEPQWEETCLDASQEAVSPAQPTPAVSKSLIVSPAVPSLDDRESIRQVLRSGESVDVMIGFEARDVRVEAHARAINKGLRSLSADELAYKRSGYTSLKKEGLAGLQGIAVLRDYENLAASFARVANEAALDALLARPEIRAVHENREFEHTLAESLPLIEQPAMAALGFGGAGTTVAVLDTGVDYTIAPFNCTSPGTPAGCRVVATLEAAASDSSLDDNGHGTNVSAIAASVAGDADIAVADVFDGPTASDANISTAISWAITNQATFSIVAMNLSLGDSSINTTPCTGDFLATPLADALAAGIQPVIASGNTAFYNGSFDDGVASPACVPAAVSVGAVYDTNVGGLTWGSSPFQCTDSTTATDKVTCFSQTAPFLSLFAPGALITAGGSTLGGTSQASPHVAGAWAVVSARFPNATEAQLLGSLQANGDPITDSRPIGGRTTSRLNFVPESGQLLGLGSGILALFGMSSWRKRSG